MPSAASKQVSEEIKNLKIFRRKETINSLIFSYLFSFIASIPGTRHFQRKNNVNRKSHFSAEIRHPFFFFCILHKIQIAGKTKEIRLMCLIRLIKRDLFLLFHRFLSFANIFFSVSGSVAAHLHVHTNTTQNRTNDTFYFSGEVIYY